jgi:DNA-binding HxlR family transcriptional regulator
MEGPKRFSDFGEEVPQLSDRMLSERLKELEEAGIVERIVHPSKPVQIEYRLTQKGRELHPVVEAIQAWANRWVEIPDAPLAAVPRPPEHIG